MEMFVLFYLLMQLVNQSPTHNSIDDAPDVAVQKFSWKYYGKPGMDNPGNANTRKKTAQRVYLEEMYNRNSIENRSRDMLELEESVRRETIRSRFSNIYGYKIEVKNNGTKEIRLVYWAYLTSAAIDTSQFSQRQFRCAVKIKPNSRKQLEGFSSLPPRQVLNADSSEEEFVEKAVINRVEYSDGEVWQRAEWHLPNRTLTKSRSQCEPL